jgi:CRISPR-associated endonuclease/helicase Cas3
MTPESPPGFWAKTDEDGRPGVSVRDHCLNVGCVAEALRERLSPAVRDLLPDGVITLAALHDVGKISPGFLRKCAVWRQWNEIPELAAEWGQREQNHAAVSQAVIGSWLGKERAGYAIAAGGHHGFYFHDSHEPRLGQGGRWLPKELGDPRFASHRDELRRTLALVLGEDLPALPLSKRDETLIVFLTGFMTFADWLGSNERFFTLDLETYRVPVSPDMAAKIGRERAAEVMDWLRWGRTEIKASRSFEQLFPFPPKPIQHALADLAAKPGLFIVEAPMGGGKTEAALAAAYQRWTAVNGQRGLYFALPTQLTSERIFDRLECFLSKALATSDLATLVHGSAWLREERVLEVQPSSPGTSTPNGEDPSAYARDARLWFASSRQALLAPFGAGTLDQALLGVLPAKHCGLRLFGLAGKVVVLDEVHSYDNYTGTLVDRLVADLIRLNATIIVLSATLTASRKRELLLSAGVLEDAVPVMSEKDGYPMITSATRDAEGRMTTSIREVPWEEPLKTILLDHRMQEDAEVWEQACQAAEAGACVLIIRNTVAMAQETWCRLKSSVTEGGPPVVLLHSRFPRWRRDELEDCWITALGKKGPRPPGCLLVATQVVEQSVDIDADLLITDLAPTDLLFQRLGRLHRHSLPRPSGFHEPNAILLHPPHSEGLDEKELKAAFGPSGFVYPPYVLWRTSKVWRQKSSVAIPQDIRSWLEATYAPMDHAPETAEAGLFLEWRKKSEKLGTIANRRSSRLKAPNQDDCEGTFTRWNDQPSADVLMLRAKPRQVAGRHDWEIDLLDGQTVVIPAFEWSFAAAKAIHSNVVRVPRYVVKSWFAANPPWLRDYLGDGVMGVVEGDNRILPGSIVETPYRLCWQEAQGVHFEKYEQPKQSHASPDEPEDGWW